MIRKEPNRTSDFLSPKRPLHHRIGALPNSENLLQKRQKRRKPLAIQQAEQIRQAHTKYRRAINAMPRLPLIQPDTIPTSPLVIKKDHGGTPRLHKPIGISCQ